MQFGLKSTTSLQKPGWKSYRRQCHRRRYYTVLHQIIRLAWTWFCIRYHIRHLTNSEMCLSAAISTWSKFFTFFTSMLNTVCAQMKHNGLKKTEGHGLNAAWGRAPCLQCGEWKRSCESKCFWFSFISLNYCLSSHILHIFPMVFPARFNYCITNFIKTIRYLLCIVYCIGLSFFKSSGIKLFRRQGCKMVSVVSAK